MGHDTLNITMFGVFTATYQGISVLPDYVRNSKVHHLFQFMLANRGESYSKEELIDLLYRDADVDNPVNALKIIIHRLRKMLAAAGPLQNCLIFNGGRYSWNPDCPCVIDVESFEDIVKRAEGNAELYDAAIELYKGEFLPQLSSEDWVIPRSVRYQEMYLSCIRKMFEHSNNTSDFKKMLDICLKAISIYPYNEELYYLYTFCLYRVNRIKEAMQSYNLAVEMLFNEFGVSPGDEMQELYKAITSSLKNVTDSVVDIRLEMKEDSEDRGAYCCNYQNFKDSYRFIVRGLERSGQSVFLMLLSLVTKQGAALSVGYALQEASMGLHKAIKSALRKGDMFTRYSSTQYLVLLVGINQENCSQVFTRIEKDFQKNSKNNAVRLRHKVASAVDVGIISR